MISPPIIIRSYSYPVNVIFFLLIFLAVLHIIVCSVRKFEGEDMEEKKAKQRVGMQCN